MAEGCAAVLVHAALGGRKDEAAVLDGAGAIEYMPMRLAGLLGERGRHRDERGAGFRQCPIERREAQVIADCEAQASPRQVGRNGALAGPEIARLAIALAAREIDVEHVDLVVARGDL